MGKDGARRWPRRAREVPLPPLVILPIAPVPALALEPGVRPEETRRRSRRRVLRRPTGRGHLVAALVLALGVLVTGATAVVTHEGPPPDATAALRRAKRVVERSDGFRFQMLQTSRVVTGDRRGAGSDTTTRLFTSGTVAARNRWHLVQDLDESSGLDAEQFEAIRVGSTLYATTGIFDDGYTGPDWIAGSPGGLRFDLDEAVHLYEEMDGEAPYLGGFGVHPDEARLDLVILGHLFERSSEPTSLKGVIERATRPSFAKALPDGGMRIDARLPAIEALDDLTDDPVRVRMELDLDSTGTPTRVELAARLGRASHRLVIRFEDWGDDLSVDPPDEDDVDRTPWVSEEDLEALSPDLLVAPREVPEDFTLVSAEAIREDGCDSLALEYEGLLQVGDPGAIDDLEELSPEELGEVFGGGEHLSLSVMTRGCADSYDPSPFELELGGLPARGGEGYWEVEVVGAVVAIDTSLPEEAAGAVAASIAPTTVDEIVEALAAGPSETFGPSPFSL